MFKRSENEQINMFSNISNHISTRKCKMLSDPNSWHQVFYNQIVSQIDEQPYAVLYNKTIGRPNSCVRRMIGMMILKEGQGWSDEQLFEECRFNIKVMRALGLVHLNDDVPAESTYYEFRRLLGLYNQAHDQDLIKETFSSLTSQQVKELNIRGKKIRMDSKLINSNIAKSSRLNLIIETVRKYVKDIKLDGLKEQLEIYQWDILKELQVKSTSNVSYPLNGQQKSERLLEMGLLIKILLAQTPESSDPNYELLKRLYEEQYEEQVLDQPYR